MTFGLIAGATFDYVEAAGAFDFHTGTADAWSNRIEATNPEIKQYDYMIIDMMLREALTAPVNFWMDLATGDVNVTILQADGTRTDNGRLFIFNSAKELVTGALNIDEIYTFVIKLGHGDPEGRYALGFAQATMLYLKIQWQ